MKDAFIPGLFNTFTTTTHFLHEHSAWRNFVKYLIMAILNTIYTFITAFVFFAELHFLKGILMVF